MEPLKGLALALDLADRQRLLAGKGLAQAQRAHGFSQSQLQQLQSYLSDSQTRAVRTGQTVAGGAPLHRPTELGNWFATRCFKRRAATVGAGQKNCCGGRVSQGQFRAGVAQKGGRASPRRGPTRTKTKR
jgi:hypothetical protein